MTPRLQRVATWLGAILVVALLGVYVSPLWARLDTWGGTFDWGYFFFLAEVDRTTVVDHHQFPFWNPYYCGGSVHLANPQTYFLSPTFLFILAFGTPIGIRLTLTAAILLAFDGTRRFARVLGLAPPAAIVAGAAYAFSGTIAQHLGGGHVGWVGFCVFPYVLHAFQRAFDVPGERRHILYGALFLAWIFGHFGGYTYPYSLLGLGVWALLAGAYARAPRRAIGIATAMVALSAAVSAVRLVPILEFMSGHPRIRPDTDIVSPHEFLEIYAVRHRGRFFGAHPYVWPEYGNYLGLSALVLLMVGIVLVVRCRRPLRPLVWALGIFALFQIGNIPGFPWWMVKQLPLFRFMRAPSRFTILVGLFACALIGVAVDWALNRLRRGDTEDPPPSVRRRWRLRRWAAAALLVAAPVMLVDVATFNREQWFQTLTTPPPADAVAPQFRQVVGNKHRMYAYPRANQGSLACFEETPVDISPRLRGDLSAEEYALDGPPDAVRRRSWSPNRIEVEVDFAKPGTVVVNQNFHKSWRVTGGALTNHEGLLAARVPAGHHLVTFRFWPSSFFVGLAVTVTTLLLMAVMWRRWRPRTRSPAPPPPVSG